MRNLRTIVFLLSLALPLFAAENPLPLMLEGRFGEARQMIARSNLSPSYELLYYAMTEADAARACSLYQVVAIRYPKSDCDKVARQRLDQARAMGYAVLPIAEWSEAPADAAPLFADKVSVPSPTEPAAPQVTAVTAPEPTKVVEVTPTPAPAPVVVAGVGEDEEETPAATPVPVVSDQPAPAPATAPAAVAPAPTPPAPEAPVVTPEETPAPETPEAAPEETAAPETPEVAPVETPAPETPAVATVHPVEPTMRPHDLPATSSGRWYVQVGAFASEDNARRLGKELEKAGYAVKFVPLEGKRKLLQVRVGGYAKRAELDAVMPKLKEQFSVPTAVVAE